MAESHEPMAVTRLHHRNGSEPDPWMDTKWSPLDKLRWLAGLVEHDTGVRIRIVTGCLKVGDRVVPDAYGYSYGSIGGGSYSYHGMWTWLNGFSDGFQHAEARRPRTPPAPSTPAPDPTTGEPRPTAQKGAQG